MSQTKALYTLIILVISNLLPAQNIQSNQENKIDSLIHLISTLKEDTNKVKELLNIGYEYESISTDTSIIYYQKALSISNNIKSNMFSAQCLNYIGYVYMIRGEYPKSLNYFKKALKINKEIDNKNGVANIYLNTGNVYYYQSNYNKAIEYYTKALEINEQINNKSGIALNYGNISNVYYYKSDYNKAVEYSQNALKIQEEINDKKGISRNLGNIGNIYFVQENYNKALEYYEKAIKIQEEIGDKNMSATNLTNIGSVYYKLNDNDKALEYYEKALEIQKEIGDKRRCALNYGNIGTVYSAKEDYKKAIKYYKKGLKIDKEIGNKYGISSDLSSIADLYNELKNYNKAINLAQESLEIAKEIKALDKEKYAYSILSKAYYGLEQYKKAIDYKELWISINDSIYSIDKEKAITNIQTQYETEKKEKQIILQQAEIKTNKLLIAKEKAEAERQQTQRNLLLVAIILSVLMMLLIYRSYKQKQKANLLLTEQKNYILEKNEELNQQNEEISAQSDEIKQQRDIVIKQRDEINEIHNKFSESIDYATRLQQSILPNANLLSRYLSEHFVLFKPKDKVSGDFYWWAHVEEQTIITAADCTGHGVPGAFMSMLGGSLLREIVQKEYITHTGVILRKLRKEIIKALKQKGEIYEQKDGMDMSIISINHKTNIVQYSGANNPLYIVKSGKWKEESDFIKPYELDKLSNIKLYEIKPDKMPISIYRDMKRFKSHEFQLEKGDQLYLFSDGYADQFGGAKGKKFMSKQFKKILLENSNKPMLEQKQILITTFDNWKKDNEQIDDIVIIGIKI